MEKKRTPELRFKGFSDDWEQRKLGDVVKTEIKGKAKAEMTGATSVYIDANFLNGGTISYVDSPQDIVENDVLILWDGSQAGTVYYGVSGALGSTLKAYKVNCLGAFIYYQLKKNQQKIYNSYRTPNIPHVIKTFTDEFNVVITGNNEQQKIGKFFTQLDNLITLHQRKLETLKSIKQGYLQQLFPKNGDNVPTLRFADFEGDWEQRKLGELAEIVRGASPRPIQDSKWFDPKSDVGWLRISDVTEQDGRITYLEQRISELGQEKTRVLTEPHLLLSIAATVGKPVVNYVKTGVHDGFLVFLKPKFEREFLFQWLEMFRPMWHKYGQPGSQVNLNSDLVKNHEITMPNKDEQSAIGKFFEQIDNLITLHQEKLDALSLLKQSYLQKMFI